MIKKFKSPYAAIALFSGGLDSILAVKWMQKAGYRIYPLCFLTPYMPIERAIESARANDIDLVVRDISVEHLEMMQEPGTIFGKNMNPCIDCHALMIRIAGNMLKELDAHYIVTGEVLGQRPMSQRKDAMNRVAKLSEYRDLIVRPLSQKLLRDTKPIIENWIDRNDMLDFSGRGRYRQLELAKELQILEYPAPAGGCLLTDKNYSLRLKDLMQHNQLDTLNMALLKYGRHFRIDAKTKLIIGRDENENDKLEELGAKIYLKAKEYTGPLGIVSTTKLDASILDTVLGIFWYYHPKAPKSGTVIMNNYKQIYEYACQKIDYESARKFRISFD